MNPSTPSTSARQPVYSNLINRSANKKVWIPNFNASRNPANRVKSEESVAATKTEQVGSTEEKSARNRPQKRIERAGETFAPTSEIGHRTSIRQRSRSSGVTSYLKKESSVDVNTTSEPQEPQTKAFIDKFEQLSSASSFDLPVSIPHFRRSVPVNKKKELSLLTHIMEPDSLESPLFLLKTPKYLPAILDKSTNPKVEFNDDEKKSGFKCTIHDLPEGQIGKLQIMKSGRLRLVLGECKFWLHEGVKINFIEELAVVKTDCENKTGEIVNLGRILDRIIVVPDNLTKFAHNSCR